MLTASFAGDSFDQQASASTSTIVFSYLTRGSFIVGNLSATTNASVTLWSPMWAKSNKLSGGPAPSSLEGFAALLSSSPPAAGGTWTTTPGQSASPPSSVPTYMAVIVASTVSKSASTVLSGPDVAIAVVRVQPGYSPNTGTPGVGTVLGFLP
jgi:hypothetical protein